MMKFTVFYVLLIVITTASACNIIYDYKTCSYKIYCERYVEHIRDWNYYSWNENIQDFEIDNDNRDTIQFGSHCKETSKLMIDNQIMNSIYLTYKFEQDTHRRYESNSILPEAMNYGNEIPIIQNLVISLDVSYNNFTFFPTFRTMSNLIFLNLSHNLLASANLFNENTLQNLRDIDLSFNIISEIHIINNDMYPFTKLERINLAHNYLTVVPDVFGTCVNLTYLDLSYNFIDYLGPITFEGIKNIVHLNMSDNRISDINASLFRFSKIQTLNLSNNKLKIVRASDFHALTELVSLNLKSNMITQIEANIFHNMRNLQRLELSDNEMEIIDKEIFTNVDNLLLITLSNNKLKTLPKGVFKGKHINLFSIEDNYLEGPIQRGMFEGLQQVLILDLSNQHLDAIENNAFYGLDLLEILLLQNNNIKILSEKCFNMLNYLKQLDLSYNKIENIAFEKENLGNLESLTISNNYLTVVKHEDFQGLDALQYLDLSNNKITQLHSNSFNSLKNLINFEISNNPLNGTLQENAFGGLNSLPNLDISCTLLNTIKNGSFNGMAQLINLDMSQGEIMILEYNLFIHTGSIRKLNVSHNKIKDFHVNTTHLSRLEVLYLNHNYIKILDFQTFDRMINLATVFLSHNDIEQINLQTFSNQKYLKNLDVSYNPKLKFNMSIIDQTTLLHEINLSGMTSIMSFDTIVHVPLTHIILSNCSIVNIKTLKLNYLSTVDNLILSHNKISRVESGSFTSMNTLKSIDLSYNQITYVQPGAFKENTMLYSLNISHNYLTSITYGIFRGLVYLNELDISYNSIETLQNERFYEVRSLQTLIADHNKIETINTDDFLGTSLMTLSIGANPIPCSILVNLQRNGASFNITSIKLDHHDENVDGITCNKKEGYIPRPDTNTGSVVSDTKDILISIRDIMFQKLNNKDHDVTLRKDDEYFANITNQLSQSYSENKMQISNLTELTSQIINKNNDTNSLLERILKVIILKSQQRPTTPAPITKDNATYENLVNYINKLKEQLEETINFEKNSILHEVENKFKMNEATHSPVHEKLTVDSTESKPIFTEICVAFILLILVCFVLYKVYKSGVFVRRHLSISTRELPGAMDLTL